MNPPHPLEERLGQSWPPDGWRDLTVLLAVSGGADSVALLRAMASLNQGGKGRLVIAHFNHRLRGQASEDDQAFVQNLARWLGLPCEVGCGDFAAAPPTIGNGLEATARRARYQFLQATAERLGARYVATAHTADDQAETILHRILRGTGIRGLGGMRRARPLGPAVSLIRPLLPFRRAELISYLGDLDQPFRDDSSNADLRFTRNRLRHNVLPQAAEAVNPEVTEALLRLGSLAREVQGIIDRLADDLAERCLSADPGGGIAVRLGPLQDQPGYLVRELLIRAWRRHGWPMQAMGYAEWQQLAEMIRAANATPSPRPVTLPGQVLAEIEGDALCLRRLRD